MAENFGSANVGAFASNPNVNNLNISNNGASNSSESKSILAWFLGVTRENDYKLTTGISIIIGIFCFIVPAFRIHRRLRHTVLLPILSKSEGSKNSLEYDKTQLEGYIASDSYDSYWMSSDNLTMREFGEMIDILISLVVLTAFHGILSIVGALLKDVLGTFYDYIILLVSIWIIYFSGGTYTYRVRAFPYLSKYFDQPSERFIQTLENYTGPGAGVVRFLLGNNNKQSKLRFKTNSVRTASSLVRKSSWTSEQAQIPQQSQQQPQQGFVFENTVSDYAANPIPQTPAYGTQTITKEEIRFWNRKHNHEKEDK